MWIRTEQNYDYVTISGVGTQFRENSYQLTGIYGHITDGSVYTRYYFNHRVISVTFVTDGSVGSEGFQLRFSPYSGIT